MEMMRASLSRFAMQSPSDVSSLAGLMENGDLDPKDIRALIVKTEGNGSATDYSVELAERALRHFLCEHTSWTLEEFEGRVFLFAEGGAEGVVSPHGIVLARAEIKGERQASPRLAFGVARGEVFDPYEIGRLRQAEQVAELVCQAILAADLGGPISVKSVLVLAPSPSLAEVQRLEERGHRLVSSFPESVAAASRRASAAGVAMALGEMKRDELKDGISSAGHVISEKAMAITKPLDVRPQVLVLGNSASWIGPLVASRAVMRDALDLDAVRCALRQLGMPADRPLEPEETQRVAAVFAKAEADPSTRIRGRRHVMMEDADIHHTRHIRSVVGTVLAAAVGHPQVFVSARAEAQGPVGGGPVCLVGKVEEDD